MPTAQELKLNRKIAEKLGWHTAPLPASSYIPEYIPEDEGKIRIALYRPDGSEYSTWGYSDEYVWRVALNSGGPGETGIPYYSTSVDAAMKLFPEDVRIEMYYYPNTHIWEIVLKGDIGTAVESGDTLPLAICNVCSSWMDLEESDNAE